MAEKKGREDELRWRASGGGCHSDLKNMAGQAAKGEVRPLFLGMLGEIGQNDR